MWRSWPLLVTLVGSFLFADNGWDKDDESDSVLPSLVTYSGMSFECDFGCGNPDYDPDAKTIQYLYYQWLPKPFHDWPLRPWEREYAKKHSLPIWEYGKLFDGSLEIYFEAESELTHDEFLQTFFQILNELDRLYSPYQHEIAQHEKHLSKLRELRKLGAQYVELFGEEYEDAIWDSYESSRIKQAIEDEKKEIERPYHREIWY